VDLGADLADGKPGILLIEPDMDTPSALESIFFAALEKQSGAERNAFLDRACAGNGALKDQIVRMLAAQAQSSGFLDKPVLCDDGTLYHQSHLSEAPGTVIGPYKLLQQIGEGGFGVVYMAQQEKPVVRRVALKVIKAGMDTRAVIARFEAERQALAMMDHPNIARVLDAGTTDAGRPYFVMELVKGIPITEYCDQANLDMRERLSLFVDVCRAVQHAHQKGVIHRDLKPSNVMVTLHDAKPVVKVIDFGIAKATDQKLTEKTLFTNYGQMIGTPAYMSPEQAVMSGLDVDTRSDVYSLGVLLYELLTGAPPFDAQTLRSAGFDEMRRIIREQQPQKPSMRLSTMAAELKMTVAAQRQVSPQVLSRQLHGDLDWIILKAIEKDRARRYDTPSALAADLKKHLENEPVSARPPSAIYRFQKAVRRNRFAFAAGAAVAASLIAGIAASVWQAVRATRAEGRAVAALDELRASAPAFAAQAHALASRERFAEAIEKLDYAIKLRPDISDYLLTKADLLQCQFQFSQAAAVYRSVLRIAPDSVKARANAALCDRLQLELAQQSKLSRESLVRLFSAMLAEHRSAAELLTIGRMVGEEKKLILDYWIERLKELPVPPTRPIEKRLTVAEDGNLSLDLSDTAIVDLAPLQGMPLVDLSLARCSSISDFGPLSGLPLRTLDLGRTRIVDLTPLAKIRTLTGLNLQVTAVRDLSPLSALPIANLDITASKVSDLSPLHGMPLRTLTLRSTETNDLKPLQGLPLEYLDCTAIPAVDFNALAGLPLTTLNLQLTRVGDLSFLRAMPLRMLGLNRCVLARGFAVLAELKSLEILLLPDMVWGWPKEEFEGLAALRRNPKLRQIEIGVAMDGQLISTTGSADEFWKEWDRSTRCVLALHRAGAKFSAYKLYDGALALKIEDPAFADLSIFHGANLGSLTLDGTSVRNLSQLAGLPLKSLTLRKTPVTDLSPLAGLALEELTVNEMDITDVSVLRKAPLCNSLEKLRLEKVKTIDLSPVAACKALTLISVWESPVEDLTPLRGLRLHELYLQGSLVHDISALAGMPLERLFLDRLPLTDITPVVSFRSLRDLMLPEKAENIEALRKLPNLQRISFTYDTGLGGPSMTAAEFWAAHDMKLSAKPLNP
jgi:serine/threonine protein kinase/Leucine-rich repeat (LRR) protein